MNTIDTYCYVMAIWITESFLAYYNLPFWKYPTLLLVVILDVPNSDQ